MNPRLALPVMLACAVAGGCGGGGGSIGDGGAGPQFVIGVDHSYFPMVPGTVWTLEGEEDGLPRHEEVRVAPETRLVDGVECTPLVQEISVDGELVEVTTEWFAQDREGNVWKFGEESFELDEGTFVRTEDSWTAGEGDARAWMAFSSSPTPGEVWTGYSPEGPDVFLVVSVLETVTVPAGTFERCLLLHENPEDPADADILLYAPGVGRVSETSATGRVDLVSME